MISGMETLPIVGILAVLGLLFGSFAGAQVWRIRARQLRDDDLRLSELKKKGKLSQDENQEKAYLAEDTKARKQERAQLDGLIGSVSNDYSRCLKCQHRLAWYDLLPLLSWLSTRGKCRYCKAPIGALEPLIEIGVAIMFVLSYLLWPLPLVNLLDGAVLILWLIGVVLLAILFVYDIKWFLLPDLIVFPLMAVGILMGILRAIDANNILLYGASILGAALALSGLYFLLWFISRGRWVGFGDVKLGLGLALILADWRLALLALFLANLIGTLVVLPGMVLGKISRKMHIPFGPLLIAGMIISMLVGEKVVTFYINSIL